MELLATVALMLGLGLLANYLLRQATERSSNEAEDRMRALVASEISSSQFGVAHEDKKARKLRKKKEFKKSPTVDKLAGKLEQSSLLQDGEGKHFMEMLDQELVIAGIRYKMTPYQALATALLIWTIGIIFPTIIALTIGLPKILYGGMIIAFSAYPIMKLKRLKTERQDGLKMELPIFIQQLRMLLSSGMTNLDDAIARVVRNAELDPYDSSLAREFGQAQTEYRLGGIDREDALRGIGQRTRVVSVENLVEAIVQGLRTGTEMDRVLFEYGKQARELWRQDMRTFKARKEPLMTLGLVVTMGGGFILIATPMMINLLKTMKGF